MHRTRFATPKLEADVLARDAQHRDGRRRQRLLTALRTFKWNHCTHDNGHECSTCAVDFILSGAATTELAAIDVALAVEIVEGATRLCIEIGQGWRLPVGAAAETRIRELAALPNDFRRSQDEIPPLVAEGAPVDLFVCGGNGTAKAPTHAILTLLVDGRSTTHPWIYVPIPYLLEHGVRFA